MPPAGPLPWEISASEVAAALRAGDSAPIVLVDVRTSEELTLASIAGAVHIPMDEVPAELARIEAMADAARVVVICHHGVRSLNVTAWLRGQGVENCQSMAGGIDRWSMVVDRAVPRY